MISEKIFISTLNVGDNHYSITPTDNPANKKHELEYIRKDIVDETIETAEDHAFFAGQEKFRKKLLKWAKEQASITKKLNGKGAMLKAWDTLIEKLNSM